MYETNMQSDGFVLGQGSMYERLRRSDAVVLDEYIFHASLVYEDHSRRVLREVFREYLDIGQHYRLPMVATTPTWRASRERIAHSRFNGMPVNRDASQLLLEIRAEYGPNAHPIWIGGTSGPKGDGYRPEEAPSADDAEKYHRTQILELADSGVDFLIAKTLPSSREAMGIARCLADTGLPYILSFVIRHDGTILDGTPLHEAINRIDNEAPLPPANYNVNCVHASVFAAALTVTRSCDPKAADRITGLDANTSAKTPEELDGLAELDTEAPFDFGANLWPLHSDGGTVYLGGCCGTSTKHIEALARQAMSR